MRIMENKVFCNRISNLKSDLAHIFEEINWKEIIKPDEKVLIKPNLLTKPTLGVTTSPEILHATIELLREQTEDIIIVETDSSGRSAKWLAKFLDYDVPFLNLSKEEQVKVEGRYGSYDLAKIALESKIVNIPVFKSHILTQVTFGVKNLFGLLTNKEKEMYHMDIDNVLFDLYSILRPEINILDGTYSMDQNGPMDGRIMQTDFIMASTDALALDLAACSVINLNLKKVGHLEKLRKEYSGNYSLHGDRIHIQNFEVPKSSKILKFGVFLQSFVLIRWLLRQPCLLNFSKKVKRLFS